MLEDVLRSPKPINRIGSSGGKSMINGPSGYISSNGFFHKISTFSAGTYFVSKHVKSKSKSFDDGVRSVDMIKLIASGSNSPTSGKDVQIKKNRVNLQEEQERCIVCCKKTGDDAIEVTLFFFFLYCYSILLFLFFMMFLNFMI